MQRQVPRSFPSQEHAYSTGWRVILLPCTSDSYTIKVHHKEVELLQYKTKLPQQTHTVWWLVPPIRKLGVLDSNPCPDFWVDNAQSSFSALFSIYVLRWTSYWANGRDFSQGGKKWSWWAASILGNWICPGCPWHSNQPAQNSQHPHYYPPTQGGCMQTAHCKGLCQLLNHAGNGLGAFRLAWAKGRAGTAKTIQHHRGWSSSAHECSLVLLNLWI